MAIFRHIKDRQLFQGKRSKSTSLPLIERLEPRILLSGNDLLYAGAPDPLQDAVFESSQQVVQYAEPLEEDQQVELQLPNTGQQIPPELDSSGQLEAELSLPAISPIFTLDVMAQEPLSPDSLETQLVDSQQNGSAESPLEESGSDIGIALVLGVDLLEENDAEPIGEGVDSECFESCQRQLIIEQLTETLRVPHGPPGVEGVLTSLDDAQLEYIDAGGQIDLVIRLNTQNPSVIEVFDNTRGVLLASYTLSEINSLTVIGGDNSDDTLTVDFSNPFSIPGGIVFAGGDGGYDKLVLIGDSELTAEYVGQGDDAGTVIVSGVDGQTTNLSYAGLEPFVYLNEFGSVRNFGIFNYGNSPEILNAETFGQGSGDTLVIEIGGLTPGPGIPLDNGYDQINVTGTATLDGTLQILLINDFHPSLGQNFEIMTFGSVVGDFATFTGYDLGGGLYLAPVKTAQTYRLDVVDYDPLATDVPQNLNVVIDTLLDGFNKSAPPTGPDAVFTSGAGQIPNIITVGGMDLELQDVTLTFSGLGYDFVNERWTGWVEVEATVAALYPDLLGEEGIAVADNDDADLFAVVGLINLAVDTDDSFLKLDDLEEEDIGWPAFLDIEITDLELQFPDFRGNDTQNSLNLSATFLGLDTGNDTLNDLLAADNPLFGLTVTGSVENLVLNMDAIRQGVRNLATGKISFPSSPIEDIGGVTGEISGKLFKVGSVSGRFILKKITYDPDADGPLAERSAVYLAWNGAFTLGNEAWGGRSISLEAAFAISTRGPLQFYFSGGQIRRFEPTTGLTIEEVHLGVRFYTTIEGMQTGIDFETDEAQVIPDGTGYLITLTIPGHDLEIGDEFRILNADNPNYDGDFTVYTVNDDEVTYWVEYSPGSFLGDADIIRLTIKDPLDLRDEGLQSVAPPANLQEWELQLDQAVRRQLEEPSVLDSWLSLFDEAVFGGGATLSIDPIPDTFLMYKVDFLIDTDFRILLIGKMSLLDGLVEFPTRLYGDLSDLCSGSGRFLYLQTQPEISGLDEHIDPLLVYRGEVSFETLSGTGVLSASVTEDTVGGFWTIELELALDEPSSEYSVGDNAVIFGSNPFSFDGTYEVIAVNDDANTITVRSATDPGTWAGGGKVSNESALVGFRIVLEGGVDLNIPGLNADFEAITVTTISIDGHVAIEFNLPAPSAAEELQIELSFAASLSETHVGNIAFVAGTFVAAVDIDAPPGEFIVIYGAALLSTNLDFLENVGLFTNVSGYLRINSAGVAKGPITLERADGTEVEVMLPARSFALRLDGSVDFRIDFSGNGVFEPSESVFLIEGIFVLEFSAEQGFNVALFREVYGQIAPAALKLGPAGNPFIEFGVLGFLIIRSDGIAADLVLTADAALPSNLASLEATAVLILNTMGHDVVFKIPAGGIDPNRPTGLSLTIPGAAPANPSAILAKPDDAQSGLSLEQLINGNTSWIKQDKPGAYGVVFLAGELNVLSLLGLQVSGYILLSEDVMSLELNFYAGLNFLNLAQASAKGSIFFSSQGEFEIVVEGYAQLGPDWLNVHGKAYLWISYLDSDGRGSEGVGDKTLNVTGYMEAGAVILGIDLGDFRLGVSYNSDSGDITVSVGVWTPYIAKKCWRTIFGRICIYYPSFYTKYYPFTVGNLRLTSPYTPPPPVVLGQVNNDGILTLNVGPNAADRNLAVDEQDEGVLIERVSAGSERGEKIRITMFGYSDEFDNVLGILIPDMGDGDDSVDIYYGVGVPVEVHFGAGHDSLTGAGPGIVTAYGDEGDDHLEGGSGNDSLFGGSGNDILDGKAGQDWIEGYGEDDPLDEDEDDADVLIGGADGDTLKGGPGFDRIAGDLAELTGDGTSSNLVTIESESGGYDIIEGDEGPDVIFGGSGNDQIEGGPGDDTLVGDDGTVNVSQEDDGISISFTLSVLDYSGNDIIDGGADDDTLFGQKGQDILLGGEGDDLLYGDSYASGSETSRNILLGDGGTISTADGLVTQIDATGQATGGADTIWGNGGPDVVMGGAAGDTIYGDAGDDILLGDTGLIVLDNGSLVYVDTRNEEIGSSDMIQGDAGNDIIIGGVNGSSDALYGNVGDDIIIGDNGFMDFSVDGDLSTLDLICSAADGLGGSDFIYGNAGDDVLVGGTGGDSIDGDEGKDLILGDNGALADTNGDTSNPRFRVLEGTVIYGETPGVNYGLPLIDRDHQFNDPAGVPQWAAWEVTLSVDSGGADYIAGGADNDQIFGQGGNDVIQGDGTIDTLTAVNAYRDTDGLLVVSASVEDPSDGDDYIEGNDGNDVIFGNLGQDDIIGGSSGLFGLDAAAVRTDGQDVIFGGAGTDISRNDVGDVHGRDSDMILGDNGNIFRIVDTDGFNYDDSYDEPIVVRAAELLDYTPGGLDYDALNAVNDIGGPDEIHGESGDDFLYGMKGDDAIFGEGQDDDIIGGYGNDWISGGTGDDGVLGDDGQIYTSRNGIAEPLYGISDLAGELGKYISTQDKKLQATINVSGELKKTVNLTPFKLGDPEVPQYLDDFDPLYADDIIFGGWGKDFLHGGAGDDAISGAEALPEYYDEPLNSGDILKYGVYRAGEFGAYNKDDPLSKVYWDPATGVFVIGGTVEFLLNFNHTEGPAVNTVNTDGDDVIFGDLGNDWLVGGTGRDHMYGGRGSDLLNADDNLDTAGGTNAQSDGSQASYEDFAYGGAGSDVLLANITNDRLVDWVGDFNLYALPYASFGANTICRNLKPKLFAFLYDLSRADGADRTLGDSDDPRSGEPNGELGLVMQNDLDWENQQTPSAGS